MTQRLHPLAREWRWRWIGLWLALVLAPVLGQMHAVAHGPAAHATGAVHAQAPTDDGWGHLAGTADCLVLDQLVHGAAAPVLPAFTASSAPCDCPAWTAVASKAAVLRHFQARAPPAPHAPTIS